MNNVKTFLTELRSKGVKVSVELGELKVKAPKGALDKELLGRLKESKQDLLAYLEEGQLAPVERIEAIEEAEDYPVSAVQKRFWIMSQVEEASRAFNIQLSLPLDEAVDSLQLESAMKMVVERHEILRTVFKQWDNGEIRQVVIPSKTFDVNVRLVDLTKNATDELNQLLFENTLQIFDLSNGPLFQITLIKKAEEKFLISFDFHHLIFDGWSTSIFRNDMILAYQAVLEGKKPNWEQLPIQYKDFVHWQLQQSETEGFKKNKSFWNEKLASPLGEINLPSRLNRPDLKTYEGRELELVLSKGNSRKLKSYCTKNNGSMYMGVTALWSALLYRYTGQEDIVLGTPVAGREHPDTENQIGLYLNTLALRNTVNGQQSFDQLFQNCKQTVLDAFANQTYPFDQLVEDLNLERNVSRSPIFDILLSYLNVDDVQGEMLDWDENVNDLGSCRVKLDLDITFKELGDHLHLSVKFNESVYETEVIRELISHFQLLASAALKNTNESIDTLDFYTRDEKYKLLNSLADTAELSQETIISFFQKQVEKQPEGVATIYGNEQWSFKSLNEKANAVANYLINEKQVKIGDSVAIIIGRGDWTLASILGILRSGASYLPMEADLPEDRKEFILEDSKTQVTFWVDEEFEKLDEYLDLKLTEEIIVKPDSTAYIIYTSGTTGKPKGVQVPHSSVANYVSWLKEYAEISAKDSSLITSSLAFDLIYTSFYGGLLNGASLHFLDKEVLLSPLDITQYLLDQKISFLKLTPTYLSLLLNEGNENHLFDQNSLRLILTGGERQNLLDIEKIIVKSDIEIINHYGPTETTIGTCTHYITKANLESYLKLPIIGKPISNNQILILGEGLDLKPINAIGEICVGGAGVSKGYIENKDLTLEKFIQSPFDKNITLYRTGDLGRKLANGTIEFLGRKDDQVKVNGYRLELGEVEHQLRNLENIDKIAVIARQNKNGQNELYAYIVSEKELSVSSIREKLAEVLPQYMIPAAFIKVAKIPFTTNGKIDKRALENNEHEQLKDNTPLIKPRTKNEKLLADIWSEVLQRENIGIRDSFYNLGGDSIKSIQIVSRLRQRGFSLKVEDILRNPMIEDLAKKVAKNERVIDQKEVVGEVELTPIQRDFFNGTRVTNKDYFNQSILLKSKEAVDPELLEKCIVALVNHHDVLRITYQLEDTNYVQYNQDTTENRFGFQSFDLTSEKDELLAMANIGQDFQSGFDILNKPLLQVIHFRLTDGDRIALICNHLVMDGVSWRILLEDLSTLYSSFVQNKGVKLPFKTDSYQAWSSALMKYANSRSIEAELPYWENLINTPITTFPSDNPEGKFEMNEVMSFKLSKEETEILQTQVHRVFNTDINDILITCLGLAVKDALGVDKSIIKMEGHGREEIIPEIDISRTVGWFTSIYPFILNVSGQNSNALDALVSVKEDLRKIPNKGIGFGILKHIIGKPEGNYTPNIVFNYLGDFDNKADGSEALLDFSSEDIGADVADENRNKVNLDVSGLLVLEELRINLRYSGDKYNSETIADLRESYQRHLQELIASLAAIHSNHITPSDLTFRGLSVLELNGLNHDNNVEDIYKLSPLQEGMYFHWLSNPSPTLYFEQMSYRLRGEGLPVDAIQIAFDGLIKRHAILRTSFTNDFAGETLQIVRKAIPSNYKYEILASDWDLAKKETYIEQIKEKDLAKGFDLTSPSQMRLSVIDLADGSFEFIWSFHHILMDGWCMSLLTNDFYQLLNGFVQGEEALLPKVANYSSYIKWLDEVDENETKQYWGEYLEGYSTVNIVPFKNNQTKDDTFVEGSEVVTIKGELLEQIQAFCSKMGVTQNTFVQAVWGYLLSRYNNTRDAVFGAIVSGRPAELTDVEEMVGLFINTIPVRITYEEQTTVGDLLRKLQKESIDSAEHHYLSLSTVQGQSDLGMDLINHILVFENYPIKDVVEADVQSKAQAGGDLTIENMDIFEENNYEFCMIIAPKENELDIELRYDANRLESEAIHKIALHLEQLVNTFSSDENLQLKACDYLSTEEKEALLAINNKSVYPSEKSVIALFEEQVKKTPNNTALVFEDNTLTYTELDAVSNQLAQYIETKFSVQAGAPIGIKLERSEWSIVSILAVLKVGGSYVPLNADYPQERLDFIQQDTQFQFCIDQDFLAEAKANLGEYPTDKLNKSRSADSLLYIMYTSGSTGTPKGVEVIDRNAVRLVKNTNYVSFNETDRLLSTGAFAFDATTFEYWGMLLNGGQLVLCSQPTLLNPDSLGNEIQKHGITKMWMTAGWFNELVDDQITVFEGLKTLLVGGDKLSPEHISQLRNTYPKIELINGYGPTENTTFSLTHSIIEEYGNIPIGSPINNSTCYILGSDNELIPHGAIGEICVGGDGLAKGYLNRPDLTAEKFIAHPFIDGERLYKTGDLGRWSSENIVEFLGRVDDQVKIRGHRIELGEIENVLSIKSDIQKVVIVAEASGSAKELVCYLVSEKKQTAEELRTYLSDKLPDYMIPSSFIQLDRFPLTTNGKVNKRA
ncbi:MAG: amino acid adenylation domain-containing protein, partial [Crocinitomix sp.]|nr:amino acid adenylation domain-containing protein [Crocinitomix sp.]